MKMFHDMLSEESGKWSFSRVATLIILLNELAWVWFVIIRGNPPTIPELGGLALFVVVLYGANKAAAATTEIATGKSNGEEP
jgi:hypothetical protein